MKARYVFAATGAAASAMFLAAGLVPLHAGVDTPPFSVTVPFDAYTIVLPGAGGSLASGSSMNTFGGYHAGAGSTTATFSTAWGYEAGLVYNPTGGNHALTAIGAAAAYTAVDGADITALGADALGNNDFTYYSGASGYSTGVDELALGVHTLGHLGSGGQEVAVGNESMVGCGTWNLGNNSCPLLTGSQNTGLGDHTLAYVQGAAAANTAVGADACENNTTGSDNDCVGYNVGATQQTGSHNILIGNAAHVANVPSDPTSDYLSIGGRITGTIGTSLQLKDPITQGTWNGTAIGSAYGGVNNASSSTGYFSVTGSAEGDVFNNAGGRLASFTGGTGATQAAYPILSAGNGTTTEYYSSNSIVDLFSKGAGGGTVNIGVAGSGPTAADTVNLGGTANFNGPAVTKGYTVATLPTGTTGARAHVTDATACSFLGTLTGGGSTFCPVVYNGSAWVGG